MCHLYSPLDYISLFKATEDDLTPEYKEERDRLMNKLKNGLVPKEKNGMYHIMCEMQFSIPNVHVHVFWYYATCIYMYE